MPRADREVEKRPNEALGAERLNGGYYGCLRVNACPANFSRIEQKHAIVLLSFLGLGAEKLQIAEKKSKRANKTQTCGA